jgi:hypothetical protein
MAQQSYGRGVYPARKRVDSDAVPDGPGDFRRLPGNELVSIQFTSAYFVNSHQSRPFSQNSVKIILLWILTPTKS